MGRSGTNNFRHRPFRVSENYPPVIANASYGAGRKIHALRGSNASRSSLCQARILTEFCAIRSGSRPAFRFYPEMKGRLIGRMRRLDTMRANAAGHGPALAKPSSHLRPRSWARLRCVWVNEEATGSGLKTKRAAPLARGWESRGKLFELPSPECWRGS
jgi:hypothetical protein